MRDLTEGEKEDLEAIAEADTRGFVQGLREPLDAAAQMLVHALPDSANIWAHKTMGNFAPMPDELDRQITQRELAYQATREASEETGMEWSYMIGSIAGTVPLEFAVGGKVFAALSKVTTKLPKLTKAANALGFGYAYGALSPLVASSTGAARDFWTEKHEQGEIGAVFGGALVTLNILSARAFAGLRPHLKSLATSAGQRLRANLNTQLEAKIMTAPEIQQQIQQSTQPSVVGAIPQMRFF